MENREVVDAVHKLELNLVERMHTHTLAIELNGQKLETLATKAQNQHDALFGTHHADDPGLLVQMAGLQSTEKERKYTLRGVLAAFIGMCGKFIYDMVNLV